MPPACALAAASSNSRTVAAPRRSLPFIAPSVTSLFSGAPLFGGGRGLAVLDDAHELHEAALLVGEEGLHLAEQVRVVVGGEVGAGAGRGAIHLGDHVAEIRDRRGARRRVLEAV